MWTSVAFLELLDAGNKVGYGNYVVRPDAVLNGSNGHDALSNGIKKLDVNGVVSKAAVNGEVHTAVNGNSMATANGDGTTRPDQSLFTTATSAVTSQIIAIASVQGLNKNPMAGFGYHTSKAAQIHLMKCLAVLLEPFGIRSNVIAPGFFPSELTAPIIERLTGPGNSAKLPRVLSPMERSGRLEEIAGTVVWMAGRSGAYTNGSLVVLDGGRLIVNPSVA